MESAEFQQLARYLVMGILIGCAILMYKITKIIGNDRLSDATNRFFKALATIIILRFIAVWVDLYFGFTLSIFSTIIGVGSYAYLLLIIYRFFNMLRRREEDLHRTEGSILYIAPLDKEKVKGLIDGLFNELSDNKKKAKDLQQDIENNLKKYG